MKRSAETTITLTVTAVGNSLGVLLSKEAVDRLGVKKGDKLFLTKCPDGDRLSAYDLVFKEQIAVARKVMKKRRNALRQLAR